MRWWWGVVGFAFCLTTVAPSCNLYHRPWQSVKVGLVAPFSGRDHDVGEDMLNGVKLAIAEWNQRGGVNGYAIELVAQDDRASAEGGRLQAQKMVTDGDVMGVIGHPANPSALAALDVYHQAGLAMLVVGANAKALTAQSYPEAHLLSVQEDGLALTMAHFIRQTFGRQRVALVGQVEGNEGLSMALERELVAQGLTVVGNWTLADLQTGWEGVVTELTAKKAEVVVFLGDYLGGASLLSYLRGGGLLTPFLGGPTLARPDFVRLAGPAAEGAYYVTYAPEPPALTAQGERFTQQFQASTGLLPRQTAALAYDATNLLLQALKAQTEGGNRPTRWGVVQMLRQLGVQAGVSGRIAFDENGANAGASVFLYRIEGATYPGRLVTFR